MSEPTFDLYNEDMARALLETDVTRTGLPTFLGIEIVDVGPGWLRAELPIRDELMNRFGSAHGGVVSALVDHVLGAVCYTVIPTGSWAATTEFKLNLLRAVREGIVAAESRVVALTRRTAVVQIEVTNDGELCALAQGTVTIKPPKA